MTYWRWLTYRKGMPQNRKIVATEILWFDFELFIGERFCEARLAVFSALAMANLLL